MHRPLRIIAAGTLAAGLALGACDSGGDSGAPTTTAAGSTAPIADESGGAGPISTAALGELQAALPHDAGVDYDGATITVAMTAGASDEDAAANCEAANSFVTGIEEPTAIQVTVGGTLRYTAAGSPCAAV